MLLEVRWDLLNSYHGSLMVLTVVDPTIQLLIACVLYQIRIALFIDDPFQNGLLNIWNLFIAIIAGLLCDKVGRRRLFMISTVGQLRFLLPLPLLIKKSFRNGFVLDASNDLLFPVCSAPKSGSCTQCDCNDMCVPPFRLVQFCSAYKNIVLYYAFCKP